MINANEALDLIPSRSELLDHPINRGEPSSLRYAWNEGAEYVREYFFNKLNIIRMEMTKEETINLTARALGNVGLQADPRSVALVLAMHAECAAIGSDINMKDMDNVSEQINREYPMAPPPPPKGEHLPK